ncbi:ornithine cyclodeaminase family protein [Aestuariispira insulae]|uniref:Ornithine cyclodeaminase n=1 Tax=Aestuariispira insulae TaxID=1461337 RepID=A0A3D9HNB0_9PROT|nr:ornithine cyclodeaminase family protein [Aestuariispira insulae]RED50948.1 ornithine cyclodeaminase [Aestuariispira insulae]
MIILDESQTRQYLPWSGLIDALRAIFREGCEMPVRHHHDMAVPGEEDATLLLMPAWVPGKYLGIKLATVFPGNATRGLPAVFGNYVLSSGQSGQLLALIDGGELTARRTAAASALASSYLARRDAKELLIVGTGRLAINLAQAHATVRDLTRINVWGRNIAKADALCEELGALGLNAHPVDNLAEAAGRADIISCCTLATDPVILGDWLKPGCHLDLVGGFKPSMRETDDRAIGRASVFVDTLAGATKEAGDITQPIEQGVLSTDDIKADLYSLSRGQHEGRISNDEITLFKSVGAACEDLAGAILAFESAKKTNP